MSATAGELIIRCFHARTAAHILHLKTRSYAAHKALNDFYDGIVPLADSFAETYQGCVGLIESYPSRYTAHDDALKMLSELYDWIDAHRAAISGESHLQNIIDEIQSLIDATQYKLRFLR
jgi:hypothetical protein